VVHSKTVSANNVFRVRDAGGTRRADIRCQVPLKRLRLPSEHIVVVVVESIDELQPKVQLRESSALFRYWKLKLKKKAAVGFADPESNSQPEVCRSASESALAPVTVAETWSLLSKISDLRRGEPQDSLRPQLWNSRCSEVKVKAGVTNAAIRRNT
jgi:hypothetical protein